MNWKLTKLVAQIGHSLEAMWADWQISNLNTSGVPPPSARLSTVPQRHL